MHIGLLTLELHIPEVASLKGKRSYIKSIKDRVRQGFNVSIAEVGDQDLWQRAELAVVMVATDTAGIDQTFAQIMNLVEGKIGVEVLEQRVEYL